MSQIDKEEKNSVCLIDAVLPLTLKDYERFKILLASLEMFASKLLRKCWVIVPDEEWIKIKSQIQNDKYEVIPETSLISEFKFFPKTLGWVKQQLIKLAIAERIQSSFYLTLDADLICVKNITYSDLINQGKAVCYIHDNNLFPQWNKKSGEVLKVKPSKFYYNVTPTVLSKEAVVKLQVYLNRLHSSELNQSLQWIGFLKLFLKKILLLKSSSLSLEIIPNFLLKRFSPPGWKTYLLKNLAWTEYSLYYTFLERFNLFETHHVLKKSCIYSLQNSVWLPEQYSSWCPENCFLGDRDFFFIVIQSTAKISVDEIWKNIGKYIGVVDSKNLSHLYQDKL
jgi:hypothetical protein